MTRARVGARKSTSNLNIMYMCHMLHSLLGVFRTYYWDIATMSISAWIAFIPLPSFLTILCLVSSPLRYKKCCR